MDTQIVFPTNFKAIQRPFPRENPHLHPPQMMPCAPYEYHGHRRQIFQLGNSRIFNKFSLSKKTSKTMEEGGPSFGKKIFRNIPARDCFFKVRKEAHWGHPSPPHHHGDHGGGVR